jgi:hypothetical protein
VYVVDGARSPFLKAKGAPGPFAASDLAVQAGRSLLTRQPFAPSDLDEVILGCAAPSPDETNIGRMVALRLGCGFGLPLGGQRRRLFPDQVTLGVEDAVGLAPAALGKRITADTPVFAAEHLAAGRLLAGGGGCMSRKGCEQNDRAGR